MYRCLSFFHTQFLLYLLLFIEPIQKLAHHTDFTKWVEADEEEEAEEEDDE
jgi:hypothetical protein